MHLERLERLEVRFTRPRVAHQQRVSSSVISVRNGRFAVRAGFAAPARSGIRARLAATDDPYRWRGAGGPNARCGLVSPLAAAAADRLRTTVTLNTPGAPIDKLHDTLHRCQRLVDKGVHSHRSTCTCVVVFR